MDMRSGANSSAVRDAPAALLRRQFDLAAEAARVWGWTWDAATDRLDWMVSPRELLGDPPAGGRYPDFRELVHPDDLAAYRGAGQASLAMLGPNRRTAPYEVQFRVVRTDGTVRWLLTRGRAEADETGRPLGMLGVTVDIHGQRDAEERLQRVLDGAGTILWEGDESLVFSEGWARLLGLPPRPTRTVAREYFQNIHPDDFPAGREALVAALKDPARRFALEYRYRRPDGDWIWLEARGAVTRRDPYTGRALAMSGVLVDITPQRRARALIELQRDLLERIAHGDSAASVIATLLSGSEALAPGTAASFLNCHEGRHLGGALGPSLPAEYHLALEGIAIGPKAGSCGTAAFLGRRVVVSDIEHDPLWEDFRALALPLGLHACWSQPVRSADGPVIGTFAMYARVPRLPSGWEIEMLETLAPVAALAIESERQRGQILALNERLEERVAERTARLEHTNLQLGELVRELEAFSYSVSHDLKAPLRAIGGFARMVVEDEGPKLSAEGRRRLDVIEGNARTMGDLVEALLALARVNRAGLERTNLDMSATARNVLESLGDRSQGAMVSVMSAMPHADADPQLVRQLFANLLENALKYSAHAEPPRIDVGWSDAERAYYVRDNGAGFDMAYVDKLFRAFERLHAPSDFPGTGIGLAIVKRVAERHGGRVWAQGAPGKGATFWFTLEPG